MTSLQNRLLIMLKWLHEYCEKHNIRYYIIGGTLLGAIRHQGFIPWDDDIDIGMPRHDYEAFIKQAEIDKHNILPFLIESPNSQNASFPYAFAKCYDTRTTLIEEREPPLKRGIFLDIFPFEGVGDSRFESRLRYTQFLCYRRLFILTGVNENKKRSFYKQWIIFLIKKMCNKEKIANKINILLKQKDFDNSLYVGNLHGVWGYKEIVLRSTMGEPTKYTFEGYEFYGPKDSHAYLRSIYNDYMILPPEEKRVSHHINLTCDLNKSYLD